MATKKVCMTIGCNNVVVHPKRRKCKNCLNIPPCKYPKCSNMSVSGKSEYCRIHGGCGWCAVDGCEEHVFQKKMCIVHYREYEISILGTVCSVKGCPLKRAMYKTTCAKHARPSCSVNHCSYIAYVGLKPPLCRKHNPLMKLCNTPYCRIYGQMCSDGTVRCIKHGYDGPICSEKNCKKPAVEILDGRCLRHRDPSKNKVLAEMYQKVVDMQ